MKSAGFDWLFIDLEHGALSVETAAQICIAALDAGISPLVRIPNSEFSLGTRLLDNGALGVVVPHVGSAEEARTVVERLRYPPQGHRAQFSNMPQFDYQSVPGLAASLNKANLIAVMLESERRWRCRGDRRGPRHRRASDRYQRSVYRYGTAR